MYYTNTRRMCIYRKYSSVSNALKVHYAVVVEIKHTRTMIYVTMFDRERLLENIELQAIPANRQNLLYPISVYPEPGIRLPSIEIQLRSNSRV